MDNNERIIAFLRASEDQLKLIDDILEGRSTPSVKEDAVTKLITQEEAARRLGISRTTVWRLIKEGALLTINQRGKRRVRLDSLLRYAGVA
jgi:excisionase family DNA binding protein|nr:MAG TPA: helix-turn-helix domain protein [Caudoviricetes sp.]